MSLDKAIEHNKEKRKQYQGIKAIDPAYRNHGSDLWGEEDRLYSSKRRLDSMKLKEKESKEMYPSW